METFCFGGLSKQTMGWSNSISDGKSTPIANLVRLKARCNIGISCFIHEFKNVSNSVGLKAGCNTGIARSIREAKNGRWTIIADSSAGLCVTSGVTSRDVIYSKPTSKPCSSLLCEDEGMLSEVSLVMRPSIVDSSPVYLATHSMYLVQKQLLPQDGHLCQTLS
jgi:hypothetical protein